MGLACETRSLACETRSQAMAAVYAQEAAKEDEEDIDALLAGLNMAPASKVPDAAAAAGASDTPADTAPATQQEDATAEDGAAEGVVSRQNSSHFCTCSAVL